MEAAADRIREGAIERCETVAVFGDYDVDGAAASALLHDYFQACGTPWWSVVGPVFSKATAQMPKRSQNLARGGAKLLIAADCGTMSHAPLAEAARLGLNPIVLDHHQSPEVFFARSEVNPNRQDDLFAGLGYILCRGRRFHSVHHRGATRSARTPGGCLPPGRWETFSLS